MERKDRGRAAVRLNLRHRDPDVNEPLDLENEDGLDMPVSDLRLGIAVLDWWQVAHRREVPDEWSLWDDPSPESMKIARNVGKGERMDAL